MTPPRSEGLYERLTEAGALDPRYAQHLFESVILDRSMNVPMSKKAVAWYMEMLSREDPAVEPVLKEMYRPNLKSTRAGVQIFTRLLETLDDQLFPKQQDRIFRALLCRDTTWPKIIKVYDGPTTPFYQQEAIFDFLDQQSDLGKGFRRQGYRTKIDLEGENLLVDSHMQLAIHSGAFWAEHDDRSPVDYVDASYHLPSMQLLIATRTWADTHSAHSQGPSIIVRLRQYGSGEAMQKVKKAIEEGARLAP